MNDQDKLDELAHERHVGIVIGLLLGLGIALMIISVTELMK